MIGVEVLFYFIAGSMALALIVRMAKWYIEAIYRLAPVVFALIVCLALSFAMFENKMAEKEQVNNAGNIEAIKD